MIRFGNYSLVSILAILLLFSNQYRAQNNFDKSKIEVLLGKITNYEYGKDRSPLSDFEAIVTNSLNSQSELNFLEEKMIKVIESNSTIDGKRYACKILSKIGTSKSTSALISLLKDNKTTNMARFALEKINSTEIDDQLLKVIDDENRLVKIGLINSLSVRRSEVAIDKLTDLAESEDVEISIAAIMAIGKIGTSQSEIALKKLYDKNLSNLSVIADAYLMIADSYLLKDEHQEASKIYDDIYNNEELEAQRIAGLKGLITSANTQQKKDSLIYSALSDPQKEIQQVGISSIPLLSTNPEGNILTENFHKFPDEQKIQILKRIKIIEEDYYSDFVRNLVSNSSTPLRIAAIDCMQSLGDPSDIELLLKNCAVPELRNASRQSLYGVKGIDFDNRLINIISMSQPADQIELIMAVGERNILKGFDAVYETAFSENNKVR
ncbi:MAG: HEAT repeat domain-containing protein, partial [Melioribacteraceae bacterium]|nr:HEAT repeat domain-containing protein [Melioribacteraceae bacterium]